MSMIYRLDSPLSGSGACRVFDKSHGTASVSRRRVLAAWACSAMAYPTLTHWLAATAGAAEYEPLNRYPRMVHEFFVNRVRRLEAERAAVLDGLATKEQAEAYVRSVRA